jgi:hypothetical protein
MTYLVHITHAKTGYNETLTYPNERWARNVARNLTVSAWYADHITVEHQGHPVLVLTTTDDDALGMFRDWHEQDLTLPA